MVERAGQGDELAGNEVSTGQTLHLGLGFGVLWAVYVSSVYEK